MTVVDVTDGSLRPEQTVLIDGKRIGVVGVATEVDRKGSLKEVL